MTSQNIGGFIRSNLLGLTAIFIALTGTALAGQQSSGGGPSAGKSVVTDAKFKKLKKRVAALEARQGVPGPPGAAGAAGAAGSALAFARVFPTGTVDEARTEGAGLTDANVTNPSTGIYCFYNLGFTPRNLQVTADFTVNRIGEVLIGDTGGCAGTEDVFVSWTQRSDGTAMNTGSTSSSTDAIQLGVPSLGGGFRSSKSAIPPRVVNRNGAGVAAFGRTAAIPLRMESGYSLVAAGYCVSDAVGWASF